MADALILASAKFRTLQIIGITLSVRYPELEGALHNILDQR
jgi:hypothetical protein